jgi:hypothetical protein
VAFKAVSVFGDPLVDLILSFFQTILADENPAPAKQVAHRQHADLLGVAAAYGTRPSGEEGTANEFNFDRRIACCVSCIHGNCSFVSGLVSGIRRGLDAGQFVAQITFDAPAQLTCRRGPKNLHDRGSDDSGAIAGNGAISASEAIRSCAVGSLQSAGNLPYKCPAAVAVSAREHIRREPRIARAGLSHQNGHVPL